MCRSLFPRALQEGLVSRLRNQQARRETELAALNTRNDAEAYQSRIRHSLCDCFGPAPGRTPLMPFIADELPRKGYRIRKLIFHSRPGYPVTANFYLPDGDGPFPAVLSPCGHAPTGKAEPSYQAYCRSLARQGFAVLIYDPVGQGERFQYRHLDGPWSPIDSVCEHNMAGNQMSLVGEFFGMWRVWDGIRALDYLLDQPEVDATRVGVTGNSGGGTLSTYLWALDDRLTMAAPSCFVTTYLANCENELPADSEQCPPGILAAGLDMGDFFIARAPQPTLLLGQARDFFDTRGLEHTCRQIKRFYGLLGAEDFFDWFIADDGHGYHRPAREAMYRFFARQVGLSESPGEHDVEPEAERKLFATPIGEVYRLSNNRPLFAFTAGRAQELADHRHDVTHDQLHQTLTRVLRLPDRPHIPHCRTLRPTGVADSPPYQVCWQFAVETEAIIPPPVAMVQVWDPRPVTDRPHEAQLPGWPELTLYVPHISSHEDVKNGEVSANDRPLVTVDVRGIGAAAVGTCNNREFFAPYGADYFYAAHYQMLGESYLGWRVHDLLSTLDALSAQGTERVHLIGRGLGAVLAALASCLHPVVKTVTLKHTLLSYHELTQTPLQGWPLSMLPWNGLAAFDLPDCYRWLAESKQLRIVEPWDAAMRPLDVDTAARTIEVLGLKRALAFV